MAKRRAPNGSVGGSVLLKLSAELLRMVRAEAEREGITATAFIREAVSMAVLRAEGKRRGFIP